MFKNRDIFSLSMLCIYSLAFIVLWEWLRPLPIITDTGNIYVFVWFMLFCFVLMYLRVNASVTIPLIFIAMMYGLHYIFFEGSFLREGYSTLKWFGGDLARNIEFIIGSKIHYLSYEFRSLLLFLVLAITSYLIHYWLYHIKKIFFFLLMTVIYVTVLDTFTLYDASGAIVRVVVASFLLMTILYKMSVEETEQVKSNEKSGGTWNQILLVIIALIAVTAFFSPKYEPYWPDPLPMVRGVVTGEGGQGSMSRTIGYSQNDERLGGGFTFDDTVVFTVIAEKGHYWRGESKEIYTGKGWESVDHELNRTFRYSDYYDNKVSVQLFEQNVLKNAYEATIMMESGHRFWHFFYPGELIEVVDGSIEFYPEHSNEPYRFLIDYVSGKVGTTTPDNGDPLFMREYTLFYQYPTFVIDQLKGSGVSDPEHIRDVYLQLPEIPERVGQLAVEITENFNNRYDKVKSIESYFTRNGYSYETTEVAIPSSEQDYVDQFLFETRQGYCDNFSTSMVVLLRSIDIPARWVKGFTQGSDVGVFEEGKRKFEISNANAHSWVEVYFPDVGWVPFEPTRGFSNNVQFVEDENMETDIQSNNYSEDNYEEDYFNRERDPENPFLPLEEDFNTEAGNETSLSQSEKELKSFQFSNVIFSILVGFTLLLFFIFKYQKKLITLFFLYLFKMKSKDKNIYVSAYERLLWLLELNGYKRYSDETLREYAERIDGIFSSSDMSQLTFHYEKLYYGNAKELEIWKETKQSWEHLIKKMSS